MADQVYNLSRSQARRGDVCLVQEDDAPVVGDTAIAVVLSVDRSIKLIMTANRHHQELIWTKIVLRQIVDSKLRFAALRVEDAITRGVREMETAGLTDAFVVIIESGNHALDYVANLVVVVCKLFPVDGGSVFECRAREPRHDLRLTQELF